MIGLTTQVLLIAVGVIHLVASAPAVTEQPIQAMTIVAFTAIDDARARTLSPLLNGKPRTRCQQLRDQGKLNAERHIIGGYHPSCEENGDYKALQCHGGAGTCWCTTTDGVEITNRVRGHNYKCEEERTKYAARGAAST